MATKKKTVDPWDLLREMLEGSKEIVSELEEEECLADCPPEWARCSVCRSRQKAGYAVRRLEGALEAHSKETPIMSEAQPQDQQIVGKRYRVWLLQPIVHRHILEDYEVTSDLTHIIGTPFGVQDRIVSEDEFRYLEMAIKSMDYHNRPFICYQELHKDPNTQVDDLIQAGKKAEVAFKAREAKAKADRLKREQQAVKQKEARELKKLEKLKQKYEKK